MVLPRHAKFVLAYNSRIDNDSVAVSVASAKIKYLDLVGTRIDMAGAPAHSCVPYKESIVILPVVCGKYLGCTFLQNFSLL